MANISNANEISLFGNRYPIEGKVKPTLASVWPEKMVTGDYTKDSGTIYSSWVMADHRGGIGVKEMREREDPNRYWWGTLNTDFKGHLVLAGNVAVNSATPSPEVMAIVGFLNVVYVAHAAKMYTVNSAGTRTDISKTLIRSPYDAIKHNGKIYFSCKSDFERMDSSGTWQKGSDLGSAQTCMHFTEWDSKLMTIDDDGDLYWTVDEGVTWTANAKSKLDTGEHTSLFVGPNASGESIVYMGTKRGLYALDFDHGNWIETNLPVPYHPHAGKGATTWRSIIYFPAGLGVYAYDPQQGVITGVGLDRDDGVPSEYRGNIVKLIAGHNALYALVNVDLQGEAGVRSLWQSKDSTDSVFAESGISTYGAVFKYTGRGWSVVIVSNTSDESGATGAIATVGGVYKLYVGMATDLLSIVLNPDLANPLEIPTYNFNSTGSLIEPYFDADNATADKLAVRLTTYVTGLTGSTDNVVVSFDKDYEDSFTTASTITTNGETEYTFGSGAGLVFKSIRPKIVMTQAGIFDTPDVRWMRLDYLKLQSSKYAYDLTVTIPANGAYGNSAAKMLSNLKATIESQVLGVFEYRHDGIIDKQVRVYRMEGEESSGEDGAARYKLYLVEV